MRGGDVAFRCNFGTLDSKGIIVDRRAGRIRSGTDRISKTLNGLKFGDVEVIFKEGVEHRAALVLRGPGLSPNVSDADPHETGRAVLKAKATSPDGEKTAKVLNSFVEKSIELLREHPLNKERVKDGQLPVNVVLPRGAGIVPSIPDINEARGMKVACVAGVTLVKGVCRAAGLHIEEVPGATGGTDTDMMAKASATVCLLDGYDMVLVNVKAPDLAGHDGDARGKVQIIERIDEAVGYIMENMPRDAVLAVTADHSTPCSFKEHTGDPVPLVIMARGQRIDGIGSYDEVSCSHGGLGRLRGHELLPVLLNMSGRTKKYGA